MNQEDLLGEVEDILSTMPPRETLRHPTDENFAWLGRVSAFIEAWNFSKSITLGMAMHQFQGQMARDAQEGMRTILTLLHQARHDLRMKTIGPVNAAMGHGRVFDYFDEIRKIIQPAKQELNGPCLDITSRMWASRPVRQLFRSAGVAPRRCVRP